MPTTTDIPADILDQLTTEQDFADAAQQAYEITLQTVELRRAELAEAEEALDRAKAQHMAASRAETLASERVVSILKRNGIVQTADGYRRADECPACGYPVNAGRHMRAIDALNCDWGH